MSSVARENKLDRSSIAVGAPAAADRRHALSIEELARAALERLAAAKAAEQRDAEDAGVPDLGVFCDALLAGDLDTGRRIALREIRKGASYRALADTLFASAARRLGEGWDSDELSFLDVSLGISSLMRVNAAVRSAAPAQEATTGIALFATLPHQSHTLGIILATEVFRQRGIAVELLLGTSADDIVAEARGRRARLVGLTAGQHDHLDGIATLVGTLKAVPDAPTVILGGIAAQNEPPPLIDAPADRIVGSLEEALAVAVEVFGKD